MFLSSGRNNWCWHHSLEFDRRQTTEGSLMQFPAVFLFNPDHDRCTQLLTGDPGFPVEDVYRTTG